MPSKLLFKNPKSNPLENVTSEPNTYNGSTVIYMEQNLRFFQSHFLKKSIRSYVIRKQKYKCSFPIEKKNIHNNNIY